MQMLPTPNVQIEQARRGRGINIFIFTFYLEQEQPIAHLGYLCFCFQRASVRCCEQHLPMAYKMKGVFKGLRVISQIFVVKEQEMDIGYPTDVKHVAHIGWDSPTGSAASSPSWMNDMKGSPDFSTLNNFSPSTGTSWTSQDFDQPRDISPYGILPENSGQEATPYPDIPKPPRKTRRKKSSKNGSPTASARSSRSSRSRSKDSFSSTTPDTIGAHDIQREIRIV
ncbi:hypothetical protein QYE76_032916 [Lolium multiflorum]|uniref:CRIB domain-containing protein n=1 Tax=Lolium multiflorum TaxID=4521 RepID=A0AAD8VLU5_LOLMU|nr:hypothetical protein QYE76_032916 [Lolium multiflorum]